MTTGTFLRREIDDRTHILICLCGMSPAVVTETVYALAQSGDPPAQVIVITTSAGEAVLREKLWDSGVWAALEKATENGMAVFRQIRNICGCCPMEIATLQM